MLGIILWMGQRNPAPLDIDGQNANIFFGFQPSQIGGAGFRWPIHSSSWVDNPTSIGGVQVIVMISYVLMYLVANYPRLVSGLVHPSDLHGIRSGLIHSKNWGEL